MDYPRCETCKWWDRDDAEGRVLDAEVAKIVADVGREDESHICMLTQTKHSHPDHPQGWASMALAAGRDTPREPGVRWAELVTAPDFGCIQHESRQEGV